MGDVFVLGTATTRFERGGPGAVELAHQAAMTAVADAVVRPREVCAVFVGCRSAAASSDQDPVSLDLGRSGLGRGDAGPQRRVAASGARALHFAWQAVECGAYDLVLCVGVQCGPWSQDTDEATVQARAASAQRYMAASGATVDHLARVAAKNRAHGLSNPAAAVDGDAEPQTILDSDVLAWPLTRYMVARRTSGAAAVVLASPGVCRRIGTRAPRLRASVLVARRGTGAAPDPDAGDDVRAALLAYAAAGLGPEDVDCAEVNDQTAAEEMAAYEALQFVPVAHGPELVDSGFTKLGGVLPVNTSGGLLSLGELDGAAGVVHVCELARQISGEAGARQVAGARVGLAHCDTPSEDGNRLVSLSVVTA